MAIHSRLHLPSPPLPRIPLKRAQELATAHNVAHLLRAVLQFDPRTADQIPTAGPRKRANPNAPANSAYFKSGPGASGGSPSALARETSPIKAPTQQPRFLQLRPLNESTAQDEQQSQSPGGSTSFAPNAATASLIGALSGGERAAPTEGIPPGSTPSQRQALSSYSQYGYTPQDVALPRPTAGSKRNDRESADDSMEGPTAAKKARAETPNGRGGDEGDGQEGAAAATGTDDASLAAAPFGPSPVKDLAALAGPGSSLRGASHPRLHRVPLGPPDELAQRAGSARFADRPQPLRPQDEGEKRMRERLVALFRDEAVENSDGSSGSAVADATRSSTTDGQEALSTKSEETPAAASRLSQLLTDLHAAVSLGGVAASTDEGGPAPCVDTVIDDHGHTALHWASALCRLSLVKMLVASPPSEGGANVQAGNYAGETALHRSVLVTNSYDLSLFPDLLELLAPSLHTRDFKSRTVLHHIALVAAMRGRATPARYYLATVLEYISKHEGGRFAALVDAQDDDGETALGIAARQGNNSMVKMLLEVGARKDLANCFGLKPSDWGIDSSSTTTTNADNQLTPQTKEGLRESRSDVVTALMRPPQAPVQKSQDVVDQMRAILDDLASTSSRELADKISALETAQSHLRSASRELTRRRGMISNAQTHVAELEESKIRTMNLKRRLGVILRREASDAPAEEATKAQIDGLLQSIDAIPDLDAPLKNELGSTNTAKLIEQRFLVSWLTTSNHKLEDDVKDVLDEARTREGQCRKVVAMYSRVEENKLEGILDDLVSAVESYSDVDMARVAGFLAKTASSSAGSRRASGGGGSNEGSLKTTPVKSRGVAGDASSGAEVASSDPPSSAQKSSSSAMAE